MAKTYTGLRNMFGNLANDSSSATLTIADGLINDSIRRVCSDRDWPFLFASATTTTVASTQNYALPYDYDSLIDVKVLVGSNQYIPREAQNQEFWDILNQNTTFTSNYPEWYFISGGQIYFYPIPSTNGYTITFNYRKAIADLSIADYTTGTVSVTNAATAVTGSGTSWNSSMIGKYMQITPANSATTNGDGFWYKISAVGSATSITLSKAYQGATVTGGSYTIGQLPVLPEPFHDLPVYEALSVYYTSINPNENRAKEYKDKEEELWHRLVWNYGNKTQDPTIRDMWPIPQKNPNSFISL